MSDFDCIILVETNLNEGIGSEELSPYGYSIFRCDRSHLTSTKSSKGGVLVAIKDKIACSRLCSTVDDVEHLLVVIKPCCNIRWLLVACYIPPHQSEAKYNSILRALSAAASSGHEYDEVFVIGDFNLPGVNWDFPLSVSISPAARTMVSLMDLFSLHQTNQVRNGRGVMLDLVFSSYKDLVVSWEHDSLLPVEEAHHPPLSFHVPHSIQSKHRITKNFIFDLKRCDLTNVSKALESVDFLAILREPNLNLATDKVLSSISGAVKANSPLRTVGSSPFPRWFSPDLKRLVINKKILHKQFKEHPSAFNYRRFSQARASCKIAAKSDFSSYMGRIEEGIPNNLRYFWSHVNALRKSPSTPTSVTFSGTVASDPHEMCELFKDFFSSVYTKPANVFTPDAYHDQLGNLLNLSFSTCEVAEKLRKLDETKGWGPDEIPPRVLKYCRNILAGPICYLLNASLSTGVFPDALKVAFVVPIHKSGPKDMVSNYRPISILSALSKVCEDLFLDRIKHRIANVVGQHQHGFTAGRSTVSNLVLFQSRIIEALSQNKQLDAVYLDFSKAFDSVDHTLLLRKIVRLGFDNATVRWLSSYLSERRLQVKFAGATSSNFTASSGVPQGSLLGPALFSLFIDDLPEALPSNSLLFADDVKVFSSVLGAEDCSTIQESLDRIDRWCSCNGMKLNADKCRVITFHRCTSPIIFKYKIQDKELVRVHEIRDLGVILTYSMSPETHVHYICSRANRTLGFIFRFSRQINNLAVMTTLYCALVRQMLEYCSPVWSPHQKYLRDELEKIQRRFIRMVGVKLGFQYHLVPVETLSRDLGLQSLEIRRRLADLVLLHKFVNGVIDCPNVLLQIRFKTHSLTRSKDLFARQHYRTNYEANSTLARLQREGNNVPETVDFFFDSVASLKRKISDYST